MRYALAIVLSTGCLVVPVTRTTTSVIRRTVSAPVAQQPGWLAIDASLHGSMVVGAASWRLDCVRTVVEVQEVTRRRETDVVDVDETASLRNLLADAVLAPVTMIPSGIVTAIVLLASHAKTTRRE